MWEASPKHGNQSDSGTITVQVASHGINGRSLIDEIGVVVRQVARFLDAGRQDRGAVREVQGFDEHLRMARVSLVSESGVCQSDDSVQNPDLPNATFRLANVPAAFDLKASRQRLLVPEYIGFSTKACGIVAMHHDSQVTRFVVKAAGLAMPRVKPSSTSASA